MQRRESFSYGEVVCKQDTIISVKVEILYLFIKKILFKQILRVTPYAESRCEFGRLLSCESQKMRFLFDWKKYFNKSAGTQFLPIARLHNVAIFR